MDRQRHSDVVAVGERILINKGDIVAFGKFISQGFYDSIGEVVAINKADGQQIIYIELGEDWFLRCENEIRKLTDEEMMLWKLEN
jgi:hypothetical protein